MAARSWNHVELIGNLTRDPELRYTPSGSAVCTFTVATNRVYVSEGERREEADFHRVVAWGKLAELCNQLLKKGNRVFVAGRLQNRSWETSDGQSRQTTEIVIDDMILLTARNGSLETSAPAELTTEGVQASVPPSKQQDEVSKEDDAQDSVSGESKSSKPQPKTDESVPPEDLPF